MRVIWQENSYRIVETKNMDASAFEKLKECIFGNWIEGNFTQEEEEQMFLELATDNIYDYSLEKSYIHLDKHEEWDTVASIQGFVSKYDLNTHYPYEHTNHEHSRLTYIQNFKKMSKILDEDEGYKFREIIIEKIMDSLRDTPFLNELDLNDQEKQAFMAEKRKIRTELENLKNSNPL